MKTTTQTHETASFAARLQELLDEAGITAYQLAKVSGLNRQTLSKYLRSERSPTLECASRICSALGVSLSAFDCVAVTIRRPNTKEK